MPIISSFLMKNEAGFNDNTLRTVFDDWNTLLDRPMALFLISIVCSIFYCKFHWYTVLVVCLCKVIFCVKLEYNQLINNTIFFCIWLVIFNSYKNFHFSINCIYFIKRVGYIIFLPVYKTIYISICNKSIHNKTKSVVIKYVKLIFNFSYVFIHVKIDSICNYIGIVFK